MTWGQTVLVIGALVAVVGAQAYWIGRALDDMRASLDRLDANVFHRFDLVDAHLDRLDSRLSGQGERVARLEGDA